MDFNNSADDNEKHMLNATTYWVNGEVCGTCSYSSLQLNKGYMVSGNEGDLDVQYSSPINNLLLTCKITMGVRRDVNMARTIPGSELP